MSEIEIQIMITIIEGKFMAYTTLKDFYKKHELEKEILKDIKELKKHI